MEKVFFISDLHFGAGSESKERQKFDRLQTFFSFINQPGNHIYIVGDLFDFWFEYKYVVPNQYYQILFQISKLIEKKVTVHFLPGNHDSWVKNFFSQEIKMQVHPDVLITEIQSKRIFLFHGDGISKKDVGYRILKKIFKNPINIFLYGLLHPDLGIPVAKLMSKGSRKHTANKQLHDKDDYVHFAMDKFAQGFDYVIVGHSHRPFYKPSGSHVLLNLGDWIQHFSYGMLENGRLSLHYWNS